MISTSLLLLVTYWLVVSSSNEVKMFKKPTIVDMFQAGGD